MSKVAKWIFPVFGGKDGVVGTAKAVVGFLTGNAGMVMDGFRQVMGAGKKGDAQARQASILTLKLGESPREAVLGVACTAGSLIDVFNFGGQYGTDKVTRCVALADHAIDGIVGFYINEVYHPWVGEGLQAAFSNKLSFHFRNATADGYDPPEHVRDNSDWGFTDRLVGLTHMWIDWYVDDKVWPQGHPEIRFVLRGLRVYDPRFDPQFGYSGPNPQTWADRSSHGFSRNAKVLRYAYTRGIFAEGHHGDPAYLLIGRGLTEEEAPADLVIADANLCDEIVDGVARYCADGVISAAQPFIEVDGMFAAAMAGVIVQREGTVDVEAGQAKAVVATFTDADLVIGEKVGFSRFLGDQDGGRLNTFIARYIEPLMGWKDHSAPVLRDLADVQADGGPREATVSLALVTEIKQALRVIEISRLLARLERRATVVLPPRFAGLEEGDWVAWQSVRRHKGATFIYRIEAYREPETWRKYLTLRQISATVFGGVDTIADQASPPPPPPVIDALQLQGVTAEAITLPGETSVVPAVRFGWTAPVDAAVQAVLAEVRRVGSTDAAPTRTEKVNDGVMIATNGVGPDQGLECRLVPFGDPTRPVLASNWITVSTAGLVSGDVYPGAPGLSQIKADIEAAFGDIFDVSELIGQTRDDLEAADAALDAAIDGIDSRVAATESGVIDLEIAVANETSARTEQINQVTARIATRPNILPNSTGALGLSGWTGGGWAAVLATDWGAAFNSTTAGTNILSSGSFDVRASTAYVLQADLRRFATGGSVNVDVQWLTSAGVHISYSSRIATSVNKDFGASSAIAVTSPATAAKARVRVFGEGVAGATAYGARRIKLENGALPATIWTDEGSISSLSATSTTQAAAIVDLEASKASVSSLDAQVARIDGVEAVNATQALALVDLENGKVAVSEYDTLKAEVLNARDGSSTLLGKIQALKAVDLDLQNNKATVSSVTALEARTTTTEADIIDLEIAVANETSARAEQVGQVEARIATRPNVLLNSTGALGLSGWTGGVWTAGLLGDWGAGFNSTTAGTNVLSSAVFDVRASTAYVLQADLRRIATGGSVNVDVQWLTSAGVHISYSLRIATSVNKDFGASSAIAVTSPATAAKARVRVFGEGVAGATAYGARRIKLEKGALPSTIWTDDGSSTSLSASVTEHTLAIIDLEINAAAAGFSKIAEASGSAPAYYEFVSSTSGGYAVIAAPVVALVTTTPGGAPLVALQAVGDKVQVTNSVEIGVGPSGATIQSAATGPRVVINNSQIAMYDG